MAETDPSQHLYSHNGTISRYDREMLLGQQGCIVWLTGLSGSGKSTLAHGLESRLHQKGHLCCVLDGDTIRKGLNRDLGFTPEDRAENIRRIGEVAALFVNLGMIVIVAFISPYRKDRDQARAMVPSGHFFEVQVSAPLEVCEARDPKGLYAKARAGSIESFTGVSAPYEPPESPELVIDTSLVEISEGVEALHDLLDLQGMLGSPERHARS